MAEAFARWIDDTPDWERMAPVPFSTVCFRYAPRTRRPDDGALDELNAALMDAVNRTGEVFLSHTRLGGRLAIRVAVGNLRTEWHHIERAWELLRREAARLDQGTAMLGNDSR
jgi:aromatic-L-amino-acid decarboxylase